MKKYSLITLLFLSFTSHAIAQDTEEYYQDALKNTQQSNTEKSETAETIYKSAMENIQKIEEISKKIEEVKSKKETKPEELQDLQTQLSLLQAKLQADTVVLQSLSLIQDRDKKSTEEMHEEEAQQRNKQLAEELKKKLENSNVKF